MAKIIQLNDSDGNVYPEPHATSVTGTPASAVTVSRSSFNVVGNILHMAFNISVGSEIASGGTIFTLPSSVTAVSDQDFTMTNTSGSAVYGYISGNAIKTRYALPATRYACNASFVIN